MVIAESDSSWRLLRPERPIAPIVLSSPHSGAAYPDDFLQRSLLDAHAIRSSEDAFVDRLYDMAPEIGLPLLMAQVPRAYLDLNRAAEELDPAVIEGITRAQHNPRIASGLGVIPRVVSGGRAIYAGKLSQTEAEDRIRRHWHPYHSRLRQLVDDTRAEFGEVLLLDCHSMPHEALDMQHRPGQSRPQVILGDRFGASAAPQVVALVESAFARAGLRVARNSPFAGAYITQHYGRPSRGQHAVQVEIDRGLYMNEARIEPRPDFNAFRALIGTVLQEIAAAFGNGRSLAAE